MPAVLATKTRVGAAEVFLRTRKYLTPMLQECENRYEK
jgi:hypothetical protein